MKEMEIRTEAPRGSQIAEVIDIPDCRYGPMLAFAKDAVITRSLQTYGEWSEHEINALSQYVRDDTLVLDVGANIGTHSLAFAKRKPRASIWGFEPQPLVNSLAWANCARNGARNVTILPLACGQAHDETVLCPPLAAEQNVGALSLPTRPRTWEGKPFGARLRRVWRRFACERVSRVAELAPPFTPVRIVPLDAFAFPLPVSLIKIDVEGMEPAVLLGACRMLKRHRPAVYFEALTTQALEPSRAMLAELGYQLFWMETHQFNRANYRRQERNLWWRTEMGVLALPPGVVPHAPLPELETVPDALPQRGNAREGVTVG